jgi:putative photosynthetic complex assembly protein 2
MQMLEWLLPPLAACLVWWAGTGAVMWLDRLPRETLHWTLAFASLLLAGALLCIARSAHNVELAGAYAAFVCAVVAWGWQEFAFLSGLITGPRKLAYSDQATDETSPRRLTQAVQVILWHELALVATMALIAMLVLRGANHVALWTFGLLWLMRLSAKLNLYLGVRQHGEEFMPERLQYLQSYFRRRAGNALMPVSLIGGIAIAAWLFVAAADAATGAERAGALLVGTMAALAVTEHVLMVLPWSAVGLWRWAMHGTPPARAAEELR